MNAPTKTIVLNRLEACKVKLLEMTVDHKIWTSMNESIAEGTQTGIDGTFWDFVTRSHFNSFLLGLRALTDRHESSESLHRALQPIATGALRVSLSDWLNTCSAANVDGLYWRSMQTSSFHRMCGGELNLYPAELASRHQDVLARVTTKVKDWVDREIAHMDKKQAVPVKIRTARRALDACTAAYCRYQLLLTGVHVDVRGVLLPNNWQQGISRPWFYLPYLHNGLCTHLPHSRKGPRGAWYRRAYGQDDASID